MCQSLESSPAFLEGKVIKESFPFLEKGLNGKLHLIVFLAGHGATHRMSTPIVQILKEHHHCVTLDYRGYSTSTSSRSHSMACCALDGKELVEHLVMEKVTLFDYSMDGSVLLASFKV